MSNRVGFGSLCVLAIEHKVSFDQVLPPTDRGRVLRIALALFIYGCSKRPQKGVRWWGLRTWSLSLLDFVTSDRAFYSSAVDPAARLRPARRMIDLGPQRRMTDRNPINQKVSP